MNPITRREFLGTTAATAAGFMVASAGTASASPLGLPIGSQTYPHRAMIADGRFVDLLKQLKSIGVDHFVEQAMPLTIESVAALKAMKP